MIPWPSRCGTHQKIKSRVPGLKSRVTWLGHNNPSISPSLVCPSDKSCLKLSFGHWRAVFIYIVCLCFSHPAEKIPRMALTSESSRVCHFQVWPFRSQPAGFQPRITAQSQTTHFKREALCCTSHSWNPIIRSLYSFENHLQLTNNRFCVTFDHVIGRAQPPCLFLLSPNEIFWLLLAKCCFYLIQRSKIQKNLQISSAASSR